MLDDFFLLLVSIFFFALCCSNCLGINFMVPPSFPSVCLDGFIEMKRVMMKGCRRGLEIVSCGQSREGMEGFFGTNVRREKEEREKEI